MIETDVIFSINVHEKKNFLIKQLENIKKYVSLNYIVIINANEHMYNEIKNDNNILSDNIVLYPEYLNKRRYHGSLTKGIYLNMKYALDNYKFTYIMILSSRNLFYNKLNKENYNLLIKKDIGLHCDDLDINTWHWRSFIKTKLSEYIIDNNLLFSETYELHEGVTFCYNSCIKIINFLDNNIVIRDDLFNFNHCVEEFGLQTICINLTGYYYHLANGRNINGDINKLSNQCYIYKTKRE